MQTIYEQLAAVEDKIKKLERTALTGERTNPDLEIGGIRSRSRRQKNRILDRFDREAKEHTALIKERNDLQAQIRYIEAAPQREKRDLLLLAKWDSIKVGDTFQPGNSPLKIIRKSTWSVTTESGSRWSTTEVVGLSRKRIEELRSKQQQTITD